MNAPVNLAGIDRDAWLAALASALPPRSDIAIRVRSLVAARNLRARIHERRQWLRRVRATTADVWAEAEREMQTWIRDWQEELAYALEYRRTR